MLLDVNLPDISGLEVTHRLIASNKSTKILIVTANNIELFTERLLEAGALGYITKNSSPQEFINAVNSVYKGKIFISSAIAINWQFQKFRENRVSFLFLAVGLKDYLLP